MINTSRSRPHINKTEHGSVHKPRENRLGMIKIVFYWFLVVFDRFLVVRGALGRVIWGGTKIWGGVGAHWGQKIWGGTKILGGKKFGEEQKFWEAKKLG